MGLSPDAPEDEAGIKRAAENRKRSLARVASGLACAFFKKKMPLCQHFKTKEGTLGFLSFTSESPLPLLSCPR